MSLLYCGLCKGGVYRFIIALQCVSERYVQRDYGTAVGFRAVYVGSLYCSLCQSSICRVIILLQSVSVRSIQGHYFTAFCQRSIYRFIILLQSVSVRYVQGHYCTAVWVFAKSTGSLLYWGLRQCSV